MFIFEVNDDRTSLRLEDKPSLSDLQANSKEDSSLVTIGTGIEGITDIETEPDGNFYILIYDRGAHGQGGLCRIVPST